MTRVEELVTTVASLPRDEYVEFRQRFLDQDWENWDREIEEDWKAGRLDFLFAEAARARNANSLRDL
jgi:hypothetical protein